MNAPAYFVINVEQGVYSLITREESGDDYRRAMVALLETGTSPEGVLILISLVDQGRRQRGGDHWMFGAA